MTDPYDINNDGIVNVTDAMAIVNEINEVKSAAERDTLCPDYYGAKGDGLPLYDWPVRCFNGFVAVDDVEDEEIAEVSVFAPSERIKTWFDGLPDLVTSESVFFNLKTDTFVLRYNGKYYAYWGKGMKLDMKPLTPRMDINGLDESKLWNDCSIGHFGYNDLSPYPDVVYSDLTDRKSYIWKDGKMTDIDTIMTDDYTAIYACLTANKGSMRLRPNACYYVKIRKQFGDNSTNPLYNIDGFHIDGNGSTLFVRRADAGTIPDDKGGVKNMDVFRFSKATNGRVTNIRIKALRDRDNGAPSGHKRFSTSDSGLVAFSIVSNKDKGRYCCNISFRDIECRGMYEDFDIRNGSDYTITNWRSMDVCQNFVAGAKHVIVSNADVEQAPFVGTGMHIYYFGVNNCWTFDSSFRQGSPFTSVMMTHHASSSADNIHYVSCRFYGNRIAQGTYMQHQYFDNCVLKQVWRGILTDDKFGTCSSLIVGTNVNLYFDDCDVDIDGEKFISTGKNDALELAVKRCAIIGKNVENITMITGFTGKLTAESNYGEWAGKKGVELW